MSLVIEETALGLKINGPKVDGEYVADLLRAAGEELGSADGEVVLDFSAVRRIDPNALCTLEELAVRADRKGIKIGLRGVNVRVYKALKLMRLASKFSSAN